MITVFVSGPIRSGDQARNVEAAEDAVVARGRAGFAVYCPHVLVRAFTRRMDLDEAAVVTQPQTDAWLRMCDVLLRLPGPSAGSDAEVAFAREIGIPVFYDIATLRITLS